MLIEKKFSKHLRFGSMIRTVDVTNVLGTLEYSERKARQEIPRR